MNEQRRKGEAHGKRLPPSERALNYAKAAVTAWPVVIPLLGLLGWSNSDRIMRAVSIDEPDGVTEVQPGGTTFEEQVAKAVTEMNARMDTLAGQIAVLEADSNAADRKNLAAMRKELKALAARVAALEELVN